MVNCGHKHNVIYFLQCLLSLNELSISANVLWTFMYDCSTLWIQCAHNMLHCSVMGLKIWPLVICQRNQSMYTLNFKDNHTNYFTWLDFSLFYFILYLFYQLLLDILNLKISLKIWRVSANKESYDVKGDDTSLHKIANLITQKLRFSSHDVINFFHIFSTINLIFDISLSLKCLDFSPSVTLPFIIFLIFSPVFIIYMWQPITLPKISKI